MKKYTIIALLAVLFLGIGCGPEEEGLASVATGLLIPRALADELDSITIYLYETKGTNYEPTPDQLLTQDSFGTYNNYKDFNASKSVTIDFNSNQSVTIKGIKDKGPVWRFYARGHQATGTSPLLIAHGATDGRIDVPSDSDTPTEVTIEMVRVTIP